MSYEDTVKAKHRFEKAVKEYLKYPSVMTDEEIEIAIARLADVVTATSDDEKIIHIQIIGAILQKFLECRKAGLLKQSKMKRILYRQEMREYFEKKGLENYELAIKRYRIKIEEQKKAHSREVAKFMDAKIKWESQVKNLTFLQKLFSGPPRPRRPTPPFSPPYPNDSNIYVQESKQKSVMGEFLIARTTGYTLVNYPKNIDTYHIEDIKDLAT